MYYVYGEMKIEAIAPTTTEASKTHRANADEMKQVFPWLAEAIEAKLEFLNKRPLIQRLDYLSSEQLMFDKAVEEWDEVAADWERGEVIDALNEFGDVMVFELSAGLSHWHRWDDRQKQVLADRISQVEEAAGYLLEGEEHQTVSVRERLNAAVTEVIVGKNETNYWPENYQNDRGSVDELRERYDFIRSNERKHRVKFPGNKLPPGYWESKVRRLEHKGRASAFDGGAALLVDPESRKVRIATLAGIPIALVEADLARRVSAAETRYKAEHALTPIINSGWRVPIEIMLEKLAEAREVREQLSGEVVVSDAVFLLRSENSQIIFNQSEEVGKMAEELYAMRQAGGELLAVSALGRYNPETDAIQTYLVETHFGRLNGVMDAITMLLNEDRRSAGGFSAATAVQHLVEHSIHPVHQTTHLLQLHQVRNGGIRVNSRMHSGEVRLGDASRSEFGRDADKALWDQITLGFLVV